MWGVVSHCLRNLFYPCGEWFLTVYIVSFSRCTSGVEQRCSNNGYASIQGPQGKRPSVRSMAAYVPSKVYVIIISSRFQGMVVILSGLLVSSPVPRSLTSRT